MIDISRGEVWDASLDPPKGREQAGARPVLVISDDRFNGSDADLVVVVPFTRKGWDIPYRIPVFPPEGGLDERSYAMCEMIRSISKLRLKRQRGKLSDQTMASVEEIIKVLLSL